MTQGKASDLPYALQSGKVRTSEKSSRQSSISSFPFKAIPKNKKYARATNQTKTRRKAME